MTAAANDPAPQDDRVDVVLILVLLIILGTALRLRGIDTESLWIDEGATWRQVRGDLMSTIVETSKDTYPPLYNLLALLSTKLFGGAEWALRLPAALLGILCIPAAWWLTAQVAGRRAGLIAATITALSAFAIYYSQEARMYSLLMLAGTLFAGTTIAGIRDWSWPRALAVAGSGLMLLYSHPWGIFSWLAIGGAGGIVLLSRRAPLGRTLAFAAILLATFLLFLPWAFVLVGVSHKLADEGFWIARPSLSIVVQAMLLVAGGPFALLLLAVGWLMALPPFRRLSALGEDRPAVGVPILIAAAVFPGVAGLVISLVTTPIFFSRYLAGCLPAAIALAAFGLARLATNPRRGAIVVAVSALAMLPATAAAPTSRHGEDWKGVAAYLKAEMQPGDCLLLARDITYDAFKYYRRQPPECFYIDLGKAAKGIPSGARVFAVLSHTATSLRTLKNELPGDGEWRSAMMSFGSIRVAVRRSAP